VALVVAVSLRGRGEIKLARIWSSNNVWNTNAERVAGALRRDKDRTINGCEHFHLTQLAVVDW
jgi:hypothetical protein